MLPSGQIDRLSTKTFWPFRRTSAGSPDSTTWPQSIMCRQSPISRASRRLWRTMIAGMRSRFSRSRRLSRTESCICASSALKGSSSSNSEGCTTSPLASATFCFCPPESLAAFHPAQFPHVDGSQARPGPSGFDLVLRQLLSCVGRRPRYRRQSGAGTEHSSGTRSPCCAAPGAIDAGPRRRTASCRRPR